MPPRLPKRTASEDVPALWASGGVLCAAGLFNLVVDTPLVPVPHVFGLLPLGVGGAVGTGLLVERFGSRWIAAYVVFLVLYGWQVVAAQTSDGLFLLVAGLHPLTRAILRLVEE